MQRLAIHRKAFSGFTLIELLIVMSLVGVLASLATLSIRGADFNDELEREARKITAQVSLLQDEAIVQSRETGIRVWENAYRFWQWSPDIGWMPLEGDEDFKPHQLPDDAEITLSLTGQPLILEPLPSKGFPIAKPAITATSTPSGTGTSSTPPPAPDFKHNMPHIMLFSSGEAIPFELSLSHPESTLKWTVVGDAIGQLKISSQVYEP